MNATLSSKGQVVLPKQARSQLRLRPGVKFVCKVEGGAIILIPEPRFSDQPKLIQDPKSGLTITQSPTDIKVTSEDVRGAMQEFP
jgi:AbrB family looped-hinge helix DNA binding protein